MVQINWLHLSDLHCGLKEEILGWKHIRPRFFQDLANLHSECGPWDMVVFTGDLTQSGEEDQFKEVENILEKIMEHLVKLGSNPTLIAVPGNHDLVWPSVQNHPAARVLLKWDCHYEAQSEFWDDRTSPYRQVVAEAFKYYRKWWLSYCLQSNAKIEVKEGVLPGDFSCTFEKEGFQLGILGLNTAFLQLGSGDYKGKLAIDTLQFDYSCNNNDGPSWAERHHTCLLLTHHPPDWLNEESQKHLQQIKQSERFSAHLCGHMHESSTQETSQNSSTWERIWQSKSLFGIKYLDPHTLSKTERSHGYIAGRIECEEGGNGRFKLWPRRWLADQSRFVSDQTFILPDEKSTEFRKFKLSKPYIIGKSVEEVIIIEVKLTNGNTARLTVEELKRTMENLSQLFQRPIRTTGSPKSLIDVPPEAVPSMASHSTISLSVLRTRLKKLDVIEFESLCLDHFPTVYDKFGSGMRQDQKINLLLNKCRHNPKDTNRLLELLNQRGV